MCLTPEGGGSWVAVLAGVYEERRLSSVESSFLSKERERAVPGF